MFGIGTKQFDFDKTFNCGFVTFFQNFIIKFREFDFANFRKITLPLTSQNNMADLELKRLGWFVLFVFTIHMLDA